MGKLSLKHRVLEQELYSYKSTLVAIKNIECEIKNLKDYDGLGAINYDNNGGGNGDVDKIGNLIIERDEKLKKLVKDKNLKEQLIEEINNTITILNATERELVKLRYFNGETWDNVGHQLSSNPVYCISQIRIKVLNKMVPLMYVLDNFIKR